MSIHELADQIKSSLDISMALLTLEEMGLVVIDDDEETFEPTPKGLENDQWLTELQKLLPGIYIRSN